MFICRICMFANAGNNRNKLQQRVPESILNIHHESGFRFDVTVTNHDFFQDIIADKIL